MICAHCPLDCVLYDRDNTPLAYFCRRHNWIIQKLHGSWRIVQRWNA